MLLSVLSAFGPSAVQAEPLIQTLPEDGEWVRFHVNLDVAGQKTEPTWTVKSVGKKDVAGVPCRWVELHSQDAERNVVLFKCLVPEAEFGKGKNPLAHAIKVVVKYGDAEPREADNIAGVDPALAAILAGPAESKKLDAKESVEFGGASFEIMFRLLISDKVPHGLAGGKLQIAAELAGNKYSGSVELSLKETGKNAKSELPQVE